MWRIVECNSQLTDQCHVHPIKEAMPKIRIEQWIAWIIASCTTVVCVTVFMFSHFVSVGSFQEAKKSQDKLEAQISKRLDRIDNKLDVLMLTAGNSHDPEIFKRRARKVARLH